jgi:hypothetical protein
VFRLANYLSTEELVKLIEQQKVANPPVQVTEEVRLKTHKKFKINKKIVFFIALALAIFHIFYVSIPLLSENRGVNAYGVTTLLAVPMDQDLTDTVNAHVVMVEKLDLDKLKVGDKVLIYGRFGTDFNWVEEVVSIDLVQGTAETTFDGIISNTITIGDIRGIYIGEASLLGIITYISSNLRGYLFLLGTYIVIFSMVYIFYIRKKEDKPIK